jgi:hypothetical protein
MVEHVAQYHCYKPQLLETIFLNSPKVRQPRSVTLLALNDC